MNINIIINIIIIINIHINIINIISIASCIAYCMHISISVRADALTTASYLVGRKTQALNSNTEC